MGTVGRGGPPRPRGGVALNMSVGSGFLAAPTDGEHLKDDCQRAANEIVGYLNFSSGASDAKVLARLNELFAEIAVRQDALPAWRRLGGTLNDAIAELAGASAAFADVSQAQGVVAVAFDELLPAYQSFHGDLLFHQTDERLFQPLFIGRAIEAVLRQGGPWDERERITTGALQELNDFVGHRPVAVLHGNARMEPYPHERVRPIPLWIAGVGAGHGRYARLIEQAFAILKETNPAILAAAQFEPQLVEEIAVDPRAYDFDHPANKRPNYQFGQWDPHRIDDEGRYRRFVLQQITLDALLARVESETDERQDELLAEAAAVLAGVTLMASGVCGRGPDGHDSSVTLGKLVPQIAKYRDRFYEELLANIQGAHGERLPGEAQQLRQPFGGARQHLNYFLAKRRADQIQRVHLALLYARMGYADAAREQAQRVPVASGRMTCEISSRIATANHLLDQHRLGEAAALCPQVADLLRRAIECGALVDPWNVLGFQANFSIFPALENSVRDHRVDELIDLMRRIFALFSRLECQAAVRGDSELEQSVSARLEQLATWWDRFATVEVSGVEHISGHDSWHSAKNVAAALAAAHQAGEASRNLAFWREQLAGFGSPKAYALVVSALIERRDFAATMALLMQWLSQHDSIALEHAEYSFHDLAFRWVTEILSDAPPSPLAQAERWNLLRKFFDFAEANAESYWQAPVLEDGQAPRKSKTNDFDDDEDQADMFEAAYEGMTYRDSTADGREGSTLESGPAATELEFELESRRLTQHLAFLMTIARLWRYVALSGVWRFDDPAALAAGRESMDGWLEHARRSEKGLTALLNQLNGRVIPAPTGSRESLLEFDRRRMAQQALLERGVAAAVTTSNAIRYLSAATFDRAKDRSEGNWRTLAVALFAAIFERDVPTVRRLLGALREKLASQPLLYRPLATGGEPDQVVKVQHLQHLFADLVVALPRLGLLRETCELIVLGQSMELSNPIGRGAVSEFDRLFRAAFNSLVQSIVEAAESWPKSGDEAQDDARLIECLEPLTEKLLQRWLLHSRSLRLSVLEKVMEQRQWENLTQFVDRYGRDLFTQSFFHLGNLRAILHQGVETWLSQLMNEADDAQHFHLLDDLDRTISKAEAAAQLEIILEAVLEHYSEYKDYNNIATQSDRGELLHVLLDYLRLKVRYERVVWNLKPVFLAHEVLVRGKRLRAAELWQQTFRAKTHDAADWHLKRLGELVDKHGLRLPSIADRLGERFVRPLTLDRIRALIKPAVEEARAGSEPASFAILDDEAGRFAEEPSGAGLDVPAWLQVLEREVEEVERQYPRYYDQILALSQRPLTYEQVLQQIDGWQAED